MSECHETKHNRPGSRRSRHAKRTKYRYRHKMHRGRDPSCSDSEGTENHSKQQEEAFNPFAHVHWRFLDGTLTREPSRQDLLRYPSEVLTDPQFSNEDVHDFEVWKREYLQSLDVAGFMYREPQDNAKNISTANSNTELAPSALSQVPSAQILFINDDEDITTDSKAQNVSTSQLPLTEEEILRQTEEYLMSLNRISQHISKVDQLEHVPVDNADRAKSADFIAKYLEQQRGAQNGYIHKRNVFSTIPSTQQLLQNVIDFELHCENEAHRCSPRRTGGSRDSSNHKEAEDDWNDSRSPSPVIIWRPSSRVTIAKDLPSNLHSVYIPEDGDDVNVDKVIGRQFEVDGDEHNVSCLELQGVRSAYAAKEAHIDEERKGEERKPEWNAHKRSHIRPAIKYGAWFIPPRKWKVRHKGNVIEYKNNDAVNPELEKKADHLGAIIPDLFISKMYKVYIETHKDHTKRDLPAYLEGVDINEKSTAEQT